MTQMLYYGYLSAKYWQTNGETKGGVYIQWNNTQVEKDTCYRMDKPQRHWAK